MVVAIQGLWLWGLLLAVCPGPLSSVWAAQGGCVHTGLSPRTAALSTYCVSCLGSGVSAVSERFFSSGTQSVKAFLRNFFISL